MADLATRIERFLAQRNLSPEAFARITRGKVTGRTVRRMLDRQITRPQVRTLVILEQVLAKAIAVPPPPARRGRPAKVRARRRANGDGRSHLRR